MKNTKIILTSTFMVATISLLCTSASAQTVNQRLKNQQSRINQGYKNGRLTGNQVRNLDRRDADIHARERADRTMDHGHLTAGEKNRLQNSLNRTSKAIYRDKHDAASKGH